MLERWSQRLTVALGPHGVALVLQRGWRLPAATLLGRQDWSPMGGAGDDMPKVLDRLLADSGLRHLPTRVLLADVHVRTWRVEPPRNATRVQDCKAAAVMRFQEIFDESAADWLISSEPDESHAFLACAVRRSLIENLRHALRARQLALLSIEPEFVALWNHWQQRLPSNFWFGICTGDALVLGVVQASRLDSVRRLPLPEPARKDAAWLSQVVRREADRLNLPPPRGLGLCGQAPPAWLLREPGELACARLGPQGDALSLLGVSG